MSLADRTTTFTRISAAPERGAKPAHLSHSHTEFVYRNPRERPVLSAAGRRRRGPLAAGVGVTADGHKLVVVNLENDSISVVDLANTNAVAELDLAAGSQ